jgi:GAF domain-containing protein
MSKGGSVASSDRLDLTEIMTRLAGLLFSEETLQSALELTSQLSRQTLPGTVGAGVTLVSEGKEYTAAYTDTIVERADALQYDLDEGPCLTAWRQNTIVRIDDMAAEQRWPRWTPGAAAIGLQSVLSAPLRVSAQAMGAIKVYSDNPAAYDDADESILQMLSDQAAIVLANVQGYFEAQLVSEQLKEALVSRGTIGQAKGILMEREGLGDEAAFAMLRQASQTKNIKLRDIAQAIVETTRGQATDPNG